MQSDLKSMSRKELEKLKANVEKALSTVAEKEKKAALAAAKKAAAAHGFSLDEITGAEQEKPKKRRGPAKAKSPSVPKYRNPDDKNQTWTGKGRQPQWFKDAVSAGTSPDELAI